MGQGAESCGGYELEYDEYEEGLHDGIWRTQDGARVHVSKMSYKHLRNTRALCSRLQATSTFSSEADKWGEWVDVLTNEIDSRPEQKDKVHRPKKATKPITGKKVQMKCYCGKVYEAREADLKRGWGLTCCKSHAAVRREYGRPAAKRVNSNML